MATMTATPSTMPAPSPTQSTARRTLRLILAIIGISLLILFAFIQIMPFVLTLSNSFKCDPAVTNLPGAIIPVAPFGVACQQADGTQLTAEEQVTGATFNPSVEGYQSVLQSRFPRWVFNTAFYAVAVTILRLIFDSMAGYALARLKFPGNRVMFYLILGTLMIPGVVLLIPRFLMLNQLNLLNTYHGYIIMLAADAFGIFLMKQFFEAIPKEIEEAAQVDGASRFTTFFRIVLPMATPALVALTIFSFQGQWNNFMDALIVVGGDQNLYNLPMGLTVLRGAGQDIQYDLVLAGSVITTIPMAIVFFIFQRYFVEGVSYSGLKG